MKKERVVFIVDIEDSSAIRAKKQISTNVSSDDFCFLFPEEKNQYDPNKTIPLLDDSIIENEKFRSRVPENYYSFLDKKRFKETLSEALEEELHILVFCKGLQAKEKLFSWVYELSQEKGSIEIFQNHIFDFEYDNPQDVVLFESHFEEVVNVHTNQILGIVLINRAQK